MGGLNLLDRLASKFFYWRFRKQVRLLEAGFYVPGAEAGITDAQLLAAGRYQAAQDLAEALIPLWKETRPFPGFRKVSVVVVGKERIE